VPQAGGQREKETGGRSKKGTQKEKGEKVGKDTRSNENTKPLTSTTCKETAGPRGEVPRRGNRIFTGQQKMKKMNRSPQLDKASLPELR